MIAAAISVRTAKNAVAMMEKMMTMISRASIVLLKYGRMATFSFVSYSCALFFHNFVLCIRANYIR